MSVNQINTQVTVSSEVQKYVTEFNSLSQKTASAILEVSKLVLEIKTNLTKDEYKQFALEVRITNASTLRKYECIGQMYETFNSYLPLLPHTWTSVYALSKVNFVDLVTAFDSGKIHPQITGDEIKQLFPDAKSGPNSSNLNSDSNSEAEVGGVEADTSYTLSIHFQNTPSSSVVNELQQLISSFLTAKQTQVELSLSEYLKAIVDQSQQTQVTGA